MGVRVSFSLPHNRNWLKAVAVSFGFLYIALISFGCGMHQVQVNRARILLRPVPQGGRVPITKPVEPKNTLLSKAVGESLYVKAAWFSYPVIKMSADVRTEIPGNGWQKWETAAFEIKKTDLHLKFETASYLYFCAPKTEARWVDNYRTVGERLLFPDVNIGVRKSKRTAVLEWFVHVTYPNRSGKDPPELYFREVAPIDGVELRDVRQEEFDPARGWVALYYRGFFDEKIHFELKESKRPDEIIPRVFQFHLDKGHPPTRIGLKEFVIEVLKVDNVRLHYKWVKY